MAVSNPPILLVDDDREALESLARVLAHTIPNTPIFTAGDLQKAKSLTAEHSFAVSVVDLCLEPSTTNTESGIESGFQLLQHLQLEAPACRVIVLTGHGDTSLGVRAIQCGAANFLVKPTDLDHLSALIQDGLRQSALLNELHQQRSSFREEILCTELIGESEAMHILRKQIDFASSTRQPVLLLGETGVGKSLCARLIHRLSKRSDSPFVRYQPGLSGSDILASELFGHRKGAFTGAEGNREGLLKRANGGTFFMDEIDGLPLETQVSLLGVLQDQCYRPIGTDEEERVDIRFLSATNGDPSKLLREGLLRKDLFHRIAHAQIAIPALRNRKEDIPLLVKHIILELTEREEISYIDTTPAAVSLLQEHDWPGNIRELEAVIEGGCYKARFAGRSELIPADISIIEKPYMPNPTANTEYEGTLHDQVRNFKVSVVERALRENGDNQVKAAKALGIDRTTLRRIIGL